MATPFVGQIMMFAGNFAPAGHALCNGQLMAISQNPALFSLLGTQYGGDGVSTFALPNLQGRLPVHQGTSSFGTPRVIGEVFGETSVTLNSSQIPVHTHPFIASTGVSTNTGPAGTVTADASPSHIYVSPGSAVNMSTSAVNPTGGSFPHENQMPYQVVTYCIALFGVFPSQN